MAKPPGFNRLTGKKKEKYIFSSAITLVKKSEYVLNCNFISISSIIEYENAAFFIW